MTDKKPRNSRPVRPDGYYELRRIVAANIRDQRQRRNWSLKRVAKGLDIYLGEMGASTISAWENSRTNGAKGFTIEEIYGLCRVFDITISELLEAPRIRDIDPIEMIAGEEAPETIAKLFRDRSNRGLEGDDGDAEYLRYSWLREDGAPF